MPFARKTATEADLARARAASDRIRLLGRGGATATEIGRALRLPTGAVETVLREVPPEPAPSAASLDSPSPGPAIPSSGGWSPAAPAVVGEPLPTSLSGSYAVALTDEMIFRLLRESGVSEPFSRGLARRFSVFAPDDYTSLDRILRESGVSAPVRSYVCGAYKLPFAGRLPTHCDRTLVPSSRKNPLFERVASASSDTAYVVSLPRRSLSWFWLASGIGVSCHLLTARRIPRPGTPSRFAMVCRPTDDPTPPSPGRRQAVRRLRAYCHSCPILRVLRR